VCYIHDNTVQIWVNLCYAQPKALFTTYIYSSLIKQPIYDTWYWNSFEYKSLVYKYQIFLSIENSTHGKDLKNNFGWNTTNNSWKPRQHRRIHICDTSNRTNMYLDAMFHLCLTCSISITQTAAYNTVDPLLTALQPTLNEPTMQQSTCV